MNNYQIYFVTTDKILLSKNFLSELKDLCTNGITAFQLRAKNIPYQKMLMIGKLAKEICVEHDVFFIVNDSLELAIQLEADGLHIGPHDENIKKIKKSFSGILGYSITSLEDMRSVDATLIDYIGVGALFETTSKEGVVYFPREELPRLRAICPSTIPMIGIGGISAININKVAKYLDGVALISSLWDYKERTAILQKAKKLFLL